MRVTLGFSLATLLGLTRGAPTGSCEQGSAYEFVCVICSTTFRRLSSSRHQIVVGGGTAGLALATKLSQQLPNDRVLVIEAGPDGRNDQRIYIPGLRGSTFGGSRDLLLPTVPQTAANNRTVSHNRDRVLGGSSALNLLTVQQSKSSMRGKS